MASQLVMVKKKPQYHRVGRGGGLTLGQADYNLVQYIDSNQMESLH